MRSSLELYQKLSPFLWTKDGWNGWSGDKEIPQWSATRPVCGRGVGWNGATYKTIKTRYNDYAVGYLPDPFRNLTYAEFCQWYELDPLK